MERKYIWENREELKIYYFLMLVIYPISVSYIMGWENKYYIIYSLIVLYGIFYLINSGYNNLVRGGEKKKELERYRNNFSYLFLVGVFIINFMIIPLVGGLIIENTYNEVSKEKSSKILSISGEEENKGNFVLGTGTIKGERVYVIFKEVGKDTYKEILIPRDKTLLKEVDEEEARIGELVCDDTKSRYFDIKSLKYDYACPKWFKINKKEEYILNIPRGTIIREIKVN